MTFKPNFDEKWKIVYPEDTDEEEEINEKIRKKEKKVNLE